MLTRLFARLLLVLALLSGQQVALAHALGHAHEGQPVKTHHDGKQAEQACEQCLAHAQLLGAASHVPELPAIVPADPTAPAVVVVRYWPRAAPAYRSRAPPLS